MIAFYYSDTALTSLTYDPDADNLKVFHPVDLQPPVPIKRSVSGETLRSRSFQHVLARKLKFKLTISSDELGDLPNIISENLEYLRDYWFAAYKYIAYKNEGEYTDYIEVLWAGDEFPIGYLEGLIYFPETTIELTSIAPVSAEVISAIGLKPVNSEYY